MSEQEFFELLSRLKDHSFQEKEIVISTLDYDGNLLENAMEFGNEQLVLLTEALTINPQIIALNLSDNNISDIGHLSLISHIKELTLSRNPISTKSLISLFKANHVKDLDLSDISCEETEEFLQAIIQNNSIEKIDLSNCNLGNKFIAAIINSNTSINNLRIFGSYLEDEALSTLANNHILTELNIARNNLTDNAVKYLLTNDSLKKLNIAHNQITDIGAALIKEHPSIHSLNIIENKLTPNGLVFFLDSILDEIHIDHALFSSYEINQFYKSFEQIRLHGDNVEMQED